MKETTTTEVLNRLNKGEDLNIIDVREYNEVAAGKIPNAQHLPLGEMARRVNELDKDSEYIVVCASGNRSKAASGLLESMGFNVINMLGGIKKWNSFWIANDVIVLPAHYASFYGEMNEKGFIGDTLGNIRERNEKMFTANGPNRCAIHHTD